MRHASAVWLQTTYLMKLLSYCARRAGERTRLCSRSRVFAVAMHSRRLTGGHIIACFCHLAACLDRAAADNEDRRWVRAA